MKLVVAGNQRQFELWAVEQKGFVRLSRRQLQTKSETYLFIDRAIDMKGLDGVSDVIYIGSWFSLPGIDDIEDQAFYLLNKKRNSDEKK